MVADNQPYALPVISPDKAARPPKEARKPAVKAVKPSLAAVKTQNETHPWEEISEEATQVYVVALPAILHCKLKWIGDSTWGSSMRKEAIKMLEKAVDERLKAMGIGK